MTFDQFEFQFKRILKAFPVTKPQDRLEAYWPRLKDFEADLFARAIDRYFDSGERFPSMATLKSLCQSLQPKQSTEKEDCNVCDGYGNVFIWGVAYRGKCAHGDKLSEKIRVAPTNDVAIGSEVRFQKKQQIEVYGKTIQPRQFWSSKQHQPHWWKE